MSINLKKLIEKIKNNYLLYLYILVSLPVIFTILFSCFGALAYTNKYKELLKNSYLQRLESVCIQNETSIGNIATIIHTLSETKTFSNITTAASPADTASSKAISDILNQIKNNNPLIDSICIYNRNSSMIYYNNGMCHVASYFSNEYSYAEYPRSYWDNYISSNSEAKILSPTLVQNAGVSKTIIPIVYAIPSDTETCNLVIVNVNLTDILSNANHLKSTENSVFLVLSKGTRHIFSENNDFVAAFEFEDDFYENIYKQQSTSFNYTVNKAPVLIMAYSPYSSALRYSYIAIIPYSDINKNVSKLVYLILIIGLFMLIISLLCIKFSTNRIYSPIESLANIFRKINLSSSKRSNNTINELTESIHNILNTNEQLYSEYKNILPLAQQHYLTNFLNSNEHYYSKDEVNFPINFSHEYFCSIVIRLQPTDEFYNIYNTVEYNNIQSGLYNIIESNFKNKYETYIIPSETNTLYILLSLPDDTEMDSIVAILDNFRKFISYDKKYMDIRIGIGGIYRYLSGLKKSHHEAIDLIADITGLSYIRINGNSSPNNQDMYEFSLNDETTLLNFLIIGHVEDAKKAIEKIIAQNMQKNLSDSAIMHLYIQILNVLFKVMRMKKINYDPKNNGEFNIITEIIKQPISEVHNTVFKYIEIINAYHQAITTKIDINAILSYITEHYNDDLGLETIAYKFNTSPKYLSKLIKDNLGINFVDYLAELRIGAAKKLLSETNKTINEIYNETGFNNRNTFIRTFKKNTGTTPSEFRKSSKKK